MTTSPFSRYANATLKFEVFVGRLKEDEETGNLYPVPEVQEYRAILRQSRDPKWQALPGINVTEVFVKGYLVEPMQFEGEMPATCECILDGREGRLRLDLTIKSPFGVEQKTGDRLQGYFQVKA